MYIGERGEWRGEGGGEGGGGRDKRREGKRGRSEREVNRDKGES